MNFKDDFKEQLLTNRVLLIRELDPDSLLPYLLQCKMISLFHEEEIRSKPTWFAPQYTKTEYLLLPIANARE